MDRAAGTGATPRGTSVFIAYVAAVLTIVMILFPPFLSLNGTEYAFALRGPEWSLALGSFGEEMGLTARVHWILLSVQLGTLWAIALGAWRLLGGRGQDWDEAL